VPMVEFVPAPHALFVVAPPDVGRVDTASYAGTVTMTRSLLLSHSTENHGDANALGVAPAMAQQVDEPVAFHPKSRGGL
jgi:hypothetical protein